MKAKVPVLNRNLDLLALGSKLNRALRRGPELGLIAETKTSLLFGFWVTLRHDEQRPVDALLAWCDLLDDLTIEARRHQGAGVEFPSVQVFVRGTLDGVRTSVLATFTSPEALREFVGPVSKAALQRLQIAGAR